MNPDGIVIAAGCYVQSAREILEQDEAIDIVISNNKKKSITEIVNDYINVRNNEKNAPGKDHEAMEYFVDISRETEYEEMGGHVPVGHTRAYVKIQDGCNNFCTYCIVPYVRGREKSRKPGDILAEFRGLVEAGYKEITLLGQNVNSYGKNLGTGYDFADLLTDLDKIEGDYLIRFMSSQPKDASHKLFDVMAASRHVAKQLHLPVQSGCDRVLRAMNRPYGHARAGADQRRDHRLPRRDGERSYGDGGPGGEGPLRRPVYVYLLPPPRYPGGEDGGPRPP